MVRTRGFCEDFLTPAVNRNFFLCAPVTYFGCLLLLPKCPLRQNVAYVFLSTLKNHIYRNPVICWVLCWALGYCGESVSGPAALSAADASQDAHGRRSRRGGRAVRGLCRFLRARAAPRCGRDRQQGGTVQRTAVTAAAMKCRDRGLSPAMPPCPALAPPVVPRTRRARGTG